MKSKSGFTPVEILIVVAIVAILAALIIPVTTKKIEETKNAFGRQIDSPFIGRIYLVTASDPEVNEVIAMPYKVYSDDKEMTDRRVFLRVSNKALCEKGIWFVKSTDGKENVIPSPITTTNTPTQAETHNSDKVGFGF